MKKEKKQEGMSPSELKNMQQQLNEGSQMMTNSINAVMKTIEEKMAMISDELPIKKELSKFLGINK
jgi:archaellum component FlaC